MIRFRKQHLLQLLETFDPTKGPLDLFMSRYFRNHKAIGSKDKAEISETIYGLMRNDLLIDHLCKWDANWEDKLQTYNGLIQEGLPKGLDPHLEVSFSKEIFQLLADQYGQGPAMTICRALNQPAPTTVRVNTLKITRDQLIEKWEPKYQIQPCTKSPVGINFLKKTHFFSMEEFKRGLFEIQDEASQLVALHVEAKPGQWVLDYCAGSGGKTLAFAPQMEHKGQIFLHDVRQKTLYEARKRLKRASIQNAQLLFTADNPKMKKKMDWVLVDVPCSGSGTWRRNPDMKKRFHEETLNRLVNQQRHIFEKALSFVKAHGRIVYATCSLFSQENEQQVSYFLQKYPLSLIQEPFKTLPSIGEMDGFFCAVFEKN